MVGLNKTSVITKAGLFVALAILLGFLKIPITNFIEIRFGVLPVAVAGMLYGPGIGAIVGGLADLGGYIVKPTGPYFPGFTISGVISGLIYGFILYNKKFSTLRITMSQVLNTVIVGMIVNSIWLSILYGNSFRVVFTMRFIKEIIIIPINIVLLLGIKRVMDIRRVG